MKNILPKIPKWKLYTYPILLWMIVYLSNLYLQFMQNNRSLDLALKFALSWHQSKFLLGTLVLFFLCLFLISLIGFFWGGIGSYLVFIAFVGIATNLKMTYRQEPLYPDDFQMLKEFKLLYTMAPKGVMIAAFIFSLLLLGLMIYWFIKSLKKREWFLLRGLFVILSILFLGYAANFNKPKNLLKKAYDKTALWIPYSQSMNYYNVGFVGGFLYNLGVEAMEEPKDYHKETIDKIVKDYQEKTTKQNKKAKKKKPNIVLVMSESFSDPTALKGVDITPDPLEPYRLLQKKYPHGKMLSVGFGGGTANIEFEALTSFSMALFSPQMTTPYTMLVPKFKSFPSAVSLTKGLGYKTTAIHPYNTSMYKRNDVYQTFGFDKFISEEDFKNPEKLSDNPYISDKAAYEKVWSILNDSISPQFIHLVTMQTHMPYEGKYPDTKFKVSPNDESIKNYSEDIFQSSNALGNFLDALNDFEEETIVVFWGDHLPSIYSEDILAKNSELTQHETEFLMYNNKTKNHPQKMDVMSPFYFLPQVFEKNKLPMAGFYTFLNELKKELPAFEKGMYMSKDGLTKEIPQDKKVAELYHTYLLLQYDITKGKKYSLSENFYQVTE